MLHLQSGTDNFCSVVSEGFHSLMSRYHIRYVCVEQHRRSDNSSKNTRLIVDSLIIILLIEFELIT